MRDRADLHTHSNVSDGINPPAELVAMADKMQLGAVALTDHDTLDGLEEFLAADHHDHLALVPGVEISTSYEGREAHLLGYFTPPESPRLQKRLRWLEDVRKRRFPRMLDRLEELDIEFSEEHVGDVLNGVQTPGRPHVARLLVESGVVQDTVEAFDVYLGKGKPGYVQKDLMDIEEGIGLLREIGSVPVLAHPFTMKLDSLYDALSDLKEMGMLGVEVHYEYGHLHVETHKQDLIAAADRLGLIKTGGSDHHGDKKRQTLGGVTVDMEVVQQLANASIELGGDGLKTGR
ncbi:PHP domain-containing protein [Candidatus Thorarchaeota archaeon]|nr:MAG: PHP domain-containing protein [Candidatus Thorarchaeota archaeon]